MKGTGFSPYITAIESTWALQATKKLDSTKGTGFSPYITAIESTWTLQAAEKLDSMKGTGFSPYITAIESTWALAPEGCFRWNFIEIWPFSAACLAPEDAFRERGLVQRLLMISHPVLASAVSKQIRISLGEGGAMRLRNFGLMVGGASVVVAIRLAVFTVAGVGLVLAQRDADSKPKVSETPLTPEQLAVYRAVLHDWMDDGESTVNLSIQTVLRGSSEPGDKGCGKDLDLEAEPIVVHRFRPEDLPQVGSDKIRLVNPEEQRKQIKKNDPSRQIRDGIGDAVLNGFAHGMATLSEIQFDKKHDYAIVSYGFVCGPLCGNGGTVIVVKTAGVWSQMHGRKGLCVSWVS
jgi:hypothetical protein